MCVMKSFTRDGAFKSERTLPAALGDGGGSQRRRAPPRFLEEGVRAPGIPPGTQPGSSGDCPQAPHHRLARADG